ncbi:MAG: hypothetical protein JSV17_11035 [Candidatus Aminicenantes bacterium]|nr:MAG: hypothetical protein JSV17_11035 [Candidatus Aminicenantes bacterium]
MVEATTEDLGIPTVLREILTESDGEDVLSTTSLGDSRSVQTQEQKLEWKRLGINGRSSGAAEKNGEGMA